MTTSPTDRDLLIELKTDLKSFKEFVKDKMDHFDTKIVGSINRFAGLGDRVTVLEQQVKENTRLRRWIYTSSITAVSSLAITIAILLSLVLNNYGYKG